MKVLLTTHYNLNNGDRAVLEATVQFLQEKYGAELQLTVSGFSPERLFDNRFRAIPWGISFGNIYQRRVIWLVGKLKSLRLLLAACKLLTVNTYKQAVKDADIIYVSGGHHLTDILGDCSFYCISANMIIPIYMKKRVVLLPQTIGGFDNTDSLKEAVLEYIMTRAHKVAFRDRSSADFLRQHCGVIEQAVQIPDLVFGIVQKGEKRLTDKRSPSVGIALYGNYIGNDAKERMNKYANELALAIDHLVKDGYRFVFIPMETAYSASDDRWLAQLVIGKLDNESRVNVSIHDSDDDSILSIIHCFGQQDVILAYKTHSVVFSMTEITPVVAIAYHQKTIDFMNEAGLGDLALFDNDVTSQWIIDKVKYAFDNEKQIKEKEALFINRARLVLSSFFNSIE